VGIEKDVLDAFPTIKANELKVGIQEENSQWVSLIFPRDSTLFSSVSSFHAKLLSASLLPCSKWALFLFPSCKAAATETVVELFSCCKNFLSVLRADVRSA
jgi:hypothetical protein